MAKPIQCILWGGYGFGNVGDELTLAVALRDMRKRFGESVTVLSHAPGYTKALFPDVRVLGYVPAARCTRLPSLSSRILGRLNGRSRVPPDRYDTQEQLEADQARDWAWAVGDCELLYLVGGGYLTDLFDIDYFLLPVQVARLRGAAVATAPLGVGPFRLASNGAKVGEALKGAAVVVRGEDSQKICQGLGISVRCRQDDGFRVGEVIDLRAVQRRGAGVVGVNFYHQHGATAHGQCAQWWVDVVRGLQSAGQVVEGFCFHNALQADFSQTVQIFAEAGLGPQAVRPPSWDFRDACRQLMGYSGIITARFHAAVTAATAGIASIAVSNGQYYRSKMKAASAGSASIRAARWEEIEPAEVVRQIEGWMTAGTVAISDR